MTHQQQEGRPTMPTVSLSKIPAGLALWEAETLELSAYPSEWELDRRRTSTNRIMVGSTATRQESLHRNDLYALNATLRMCRELGWSPLRNR